jgi:hypothetical protein
MLSAKGAAFNQACGNAPGFMGIQRSALKARFSIFSADERESRFQR